MYSFYTALIVTFYYALMPLWARAEPLPPGGLRKVPHPEPGRHKTCGVQCTNLQPLNTTVPTVPPPAKLPCDVTVTATDGSEVRALSSTPKGSMGSFRLGPSQVATAIYHLTVDELWYITSGSGYIWRAPSGHPEQGKVDRLEPGVSIAIPVGTHFQWRADGGAALDVLGVDAPAWPGDGEAVLSNMAPWRATVGDAA